MYMEIIFGYSSKLGRWNWLANQLSLSTSIKGESIYNILYIVLPHR